MLNRPIMDAGPGLNFFSIHKERLLFSILGPLSMPETVQSEILRKARTDPRFAPAKTVLGKLPPTLLEVLSDDYTLELAQVVARISGTPFQERKRVGEDLGETMVIAHAVVTAEGGTDVIILIDERRGREIAGREQQRLKRLQTMGEPVGSIGLVSTVTVLKKAAVQGLVPGKTEMQCIYGRLRGLDDGLPPIGATELMSSNLWQ